MAHIYQAYVDTTHEQDIFVGTYNTPKEAHEAIDQYMLEHQLAEGFNACGCIVEHYVELIPEQFERLDDWHYVWYYDDDERIHLYVIDNTYIVHHQVGISGESYRFDYAQLMRYLKDF